MINANKRSRNNQADDGEHLRSAYEKAKTYIRKNQKDGLWPYVSGRLPATEASAWCAIALRDNATVRVAALEALLEARNPDGGWSTEPHLSGKSDWTSGPALLALRILGEKMPASKQLDAAVRKALEYMFDSRTEFYGSMARLLLFMTRGAPGLEYARGWPWTSDCFHWIEPTTYALLSLKIPSAPRQEVYAAIIESARRFVLEHECQGGGWNHGSDFCLGVHLPPYIVTTAEALLGLQGTPTGKPIKSALDFLQATEPSQCSAMEHAWAILALQIYDRPTEHLVHSLVRGQNQDGSFGVNLMVTALSALALDTAISGSNPFKERAGGATAKTLAPNGT